MQRSGTSHSALSRAPRSIRILAPVVVAAVVGTAWLADAAGEHDGPSRLDPTTAAEVLRLRTPTLTELAHALSFVGSEVVVGLLALLVMGRLAVRRDLGRASVFALGIGGSAFLTVAVKLAVGRTRPGAVDRLGALDASYSFPSGHTLNSAVLIALATWLLWPALSRLTRGFAVAGGMLLATGIGASRIYLGYHWVTDVIASGLVAVAWLSLVWMVRGPVQDLARRPGRLRPAS